MDISVVIPVYKNTEEFLKNLKHNMQFLKGMEIILVNDDPETSLKEHVKEYSNIILLENSVNIGFGQTVNRGIGKATHSYILLLNTDVLLQDQSFEEGIKRFQEDKNMFGISFEQIERDGSLVGKNKLFWENGFATHSKADNLEYGPNGWVECGSCLIDTEKFKLIGGFDPLYSPVYWEDVDLSYRARKNGFIALFDPAIKVIHHHESTTGKYFTKDYIKTIAFRNQLIFIWKNVEDKKLMQEHIFALAKLLVGSIIKGDRVVLKGFWAALMKWNAIQEKRREQKKFNKLNDRELLA